MDKLYTQFALSSLIDCRLGTLKEADCKPSDPALRTIINRLRLNGSSILQGWVQDDQFIYKNEQRPLEVFAHFLHKRKKLLIVVNGISILHARNQSGAELGIEIRSINCLRR